MSIKNIYSDQYLQTTKSDVYGGVDVSITVTPKLAELLTWIEQFRATEEYEKILRNSDPNVKLAWDSYKMSVALSK